MTEKKQQHISTSWLPYMFQINFALPFEFLSHIPLCRSLLSEGVVSVQLTKCQLIFVDASF